MSSSSQEQGISTQELNSDIGWSLGIAAGSLAVAAVTGYATYKTLTGKRDDWEPAVFEGGGFLTSASIALKTVPQAASLIRERITRGRVSEK